MNGCRADYVHIHVGGTHSLCLIVDSKKDIILKYGHEDVDGGPGSLTRFFTFFNSWTYMYLSCRDFHFFTHFSAVPPVSNATIFYAFSLAVRSLKALQLTFHKQCKLRTASMRHSQLSFSAAVMKQVQVAVIYCTDVVYIICGIQ